MPEELDVVGQLPPLQFIGFSGAADVDVKLPIELAVRYHLRLVVGAAARFAEQAAQLECGRPDGAVGRRSVCYLYMVAMLAFLG
jgi:hypothetical protein